MGMPTVAVYLMLATLVAPALIEVAITVPDEPNSSSLKVSLNQCKDDLPNGFQLVIY